MVQLQRIVSRRVGGKVYHKWQVVLPPSAVEQIGWKAGDELEVEIGRDRITLRGGEERGRRK